MVLLLLAWNRQGAGFIFKQTERGLYCAYLKISRQMAGSRCKFSWLVGRNLKS